MYVNIKRIYIDLTSEYTPKNGIPLTILIREKGNTITKNKIVNKKILLKKATFTLKKNTK